MHKTFCNAKLHRVRVTSCNPDYEGSIGICSELMKAAKISKYEQVHVLNVSNGSRFVTYAIPAPTGHIDILGAAARLCNIDDILIVMSYCLLTPQEAQEHEPIVLLVNDVNASINVNSHMEVNS